MRSRRSARGLALPSDLVDPGEEGGDLGVDGRGVEPSAPSAHGDDPRHVILLPRAASAHEGATRVPLPWKPQVVTYRQ